MDDDDKFHVFFITPVTRGNSSAVNLGTIVGKSGKFDTEEEALAFAHAEFSDAKAQGANRAKIHHKQRMYEVIKED
jgi:hypothetical protein